MALPLDPEPPPIRVDEDGAVRVGPTRVTLDVVIGLFLKGETPDEIVEGFPTVTLADVYGTIAYYLRHRDEVDLFLREQERRAEELRVKIQSRPEHKDFTERVLARARAGQIKA
jgi:uncharacterized protein (DUF433 family)